VQRTDEFSQTRRKYLLRKRREQVRCLAASAEPLLLDMNMQPLLAG
jgi:hypothetical protein